MANDEARAAAYWLNGDNPGPDVPKPMEDSLADLLTRYAAKAVNDKLEVAAQRAEFDLRASGHLEVNRAADIVTASIRALKEQAK